MKRITRVLAWVVAVVNAANFLASAVYRTHRFLDQHSWWVLREHRNYLGRDQSLFRLISNVFFDYLFVLPYIAIIFFVSMHIAKGTHASEGLKKGALLGLFVGGSLSTAFIAVAMIPRSSAILQDGTAEWALAWLPFIWLGYPSLVVGAVLGLLTAAVHRSITRRHSRMAGSA